MKPFSTLHSHIFSPVSSIGEDNEEASSARTTSTPVIDPTNRINVKGAREVYEESENSVQVLLAMAIGYKGHDDGVQLVDFNAEPFVSAPRSRQWKPTTKQLTLELRRRWEKRNREGKKPGTQWRMEKIFVLAI